MVAFAPDRHRPGGLHDRAGVGLVLVLFVVQSQTQRNDDQRVRVLRQELHAVVISQYVLVIRGINPSS